MSWGKEVKKVPGERRLSSEKREGNFFFNEEGNKSAENLGAEGKDF